MAGEAKRPSEMSDECEKPLPSPSSFSSGLPRPERPQCSAAAFPDSLPFPPEASKAPLLDSFPNIRALPVVGPQTQWDSINVPILPVDITHGVLQNGLTYYVQENREPKQRAELFLVVGFGSLVEEEDERGIAHIIEHLGFSATKDYENHAIVKFLESIGAPFGACQNAYTAFDRTVYTLHVPTDKAELVKESLTVLREFAFFTRISEEDLEKERKVVLEEWRESKNAQGRLFEQYLCALAKDCKYSERLPIGIEHVIRNVPAETLRKFYTKFYHPARMAVVAVGDFEGVAIVTAIQELFNLPPEAISPLPRVPVAEAPERPWYVVPESEGMAVASSADPELSFAQGMVDCKRHRQSTKSVADFRRNLCEELFHKAMNTRLLKLVLEPKGPRNFFMVSSETGEPIPPLNPMSITVAPLPGRMRYALQEIARELERVKRLGFHDAEINRAKRSALAEFEEQYIERNQISSDSLADGYVELFLDGKPAPGIVQMAQIVVTIMPSMTCAEISAVAGQFNFERNVVVKIATPPFSIWNMIYTSWGVLQSCWNRKLPRSKMDLPNDSEVAALLRAAQKEELEQWPEDEDDVDTRLQRKFDSCKAKRLALPDVMSSTTRAVHASGVPRPLRNGSVSTDDRSEEFLLGEEIILQNGLRVLLKDTDLFEDEILLKGQRWGGLSAYQKSVWLGNKSGAVSTEAQVCTLTAMMLGICGLSVESLEECLEGRRVDPNPPQMDAYRTTFDASCSPTDLELLLTLVNLMFLCPVDPAGNSRGRLGLVKLGLLAARLAEDRDPASKFQKRVSRCTTDDHPFHKSPSIWSILRCNFRTASRIFNECTSAPKDWTFVLVGRLPSKEVLLPLLDTYFGTIPNKGDALGVVPACVKRRGELEIRNEVIPISVPFPAKPVRDEVYLRMVDPKGSTVICFPIKLEAVTMDGDLDSAEAELRNMFVIRFLVRMLETKLIEVLRFQRGQVYGASVKSDFSLAPPHLGVVGHGTLSISFECDPAESDELIEVTLAELQLFRAGSAEFTDANLSAALEQDKREFEELTQKNSFWANIILDLYFSRAHAIIGELGAAMAFWWRIRTDVSARLTAATASEALRVLLPEGTSSAIITMRPKLGCCASCKKRCSQ